MRRKLSNASEKEDFDLVIHGSPEHVSSTQELESHGMEQSLY